MNENITYKNQKQQMQRNEVAIQNRQNNKINK